VRTIRQARPSLITASVYDRDQLHENLLTKQYFIEVDMNHLINFNADLANKMTTSPADFLPLVKYIMFVKKKKKKIRLLATKFIISLKTPSKNVPSVSYL
jgi:DNA replication licensing factor MCM5